MDRDIEIKINLTSDHPIQETIVVCTILKRPEGKYNDAEDARSSPAIWNCSVPPMYRVKLQSRGRDSFEGGVCNISDFPEY
jgi:hypothetical protein